jgi:hypothetical protein
MHRGPGLLLCLFAAAAICAHASVALLMEEPYGEFGAVNPTGHAAVYSGARGNRRRRCGLPGRRPHEITQGHAGVRYWRRGNYQRPGPARRPQSASCPAGCRGSALGSVSRAEQRFLILNTSSSFLAGPPRVSGSKAIYLPCAGVWCVNCWSCMTNLGSRVF